MKKETEIKYAHSNREVHVYELDTKSVKDKLDPKIYICSYSKFIGFYLEEDATKFTLPKKIYGHTNDRVNRIINTYKDRTSNTGVLLIGDKGAGKSLLSQVLANELLEQGYPIILIQQPYLGDAFMSFINKLGDCVVIFDEFAKTYSQAEDEPDAQEKLLTLFDGASGATSDSKILWLVLENEKHKLNDYLLNRPGRFYYRFEYDGLEEDAIIDYLKDKKIDTNSKFAMDLLDYSRSQSTFSFDILKSIVEEYLRYNETLEEIVKVLNVEREDDREEERILAIIDKETQDELPLRREMTRFQYDLHIYHAIDDENIREQFKKSGKDAFIDYRDIKYTEGLKNIYENDDFIMITETVPKAKIDYKKYL